MSLRAYILPMVFISVVLLLSGCGKEEVKAPGVYVDETKSVLMKDLSPRDVIVRVNGVGITKHDFLVRRSLNEKVYRLRNKIELGAKNKKAKRYIQSMEKSIPNEYIRHELIRQAADEAGITVSEKRIKSEYKKFLNYIGRPKDSMEKVIALIGEEEGRVLVDFMRDGIRGELLRDTLATNGYYTVTDEMVSNHLARIAAWNKNADRLNERARKKASQFREKVINGGDFTELGKKVAQLFPEYAEKWDSFQLMEFTEENQQLRDWLATANTGDISGPIDLDDGIAIVKVVDKWKEPQGEGHEPVDEFELVRCTFKAYQYTLNETEDEIRRQYLVELEKNLMGQLGEQLWKNAVIEFPNGRDFWGKAKKPSPVESDESLRSNNMEVASEGTADKEVVPDGAVDKEVVPDGAADKEGSK